MSRIKQLLIDGTQREMDNTQEIRNKSNPDRTQILFVYGTLKRNGRFNNTFLKEAQFLSEITAQKGIMFHCHAFPAVSFEEELTPIHGELYKVNWAELERIDGLEGHPHHYLRISLQFPNIGQVWTYVYPKHVAANMKHAIPTGEWIGPETPKVPWLGFGKGMVLGAAGSLPRRLEAVPGSRLVQPCGPNYIRQKVDPPVGADKTKDWYLMTNEVTGESYGPFEDRGFASNGKPKIGLPKPIVEATRKCLAVPESDATIVPKVEERNKPKPQDTTEIRYPSRIGPGVRYL